MNRQTLSTFFLLFFLCTACGVPLPMQKDIVIKDIGTVRQFSTSDPVFASYVDKFQSEAKSTLSLESFEIGDIPINFGDTENELYQGVCFAYADGAKEVIVRKAWWEKASDTYKTSLLFHELGHCRLDRSHKEDVYTLENGDEYKISIMHPIILSPVDFTTYYDQYLKELFSGNDEPIISAFKALE